MHAVQFTHSIWVPSRMSIPVGQTTTHCLQSTQCEQLLHSSQRVQWVHW